MGNTLFRPPGQARPGMSPARTQRGGNPDGLRTPRSSESPASDSAGTRPRARTSRRPSQPARRADRAILRARLDKLLADDRHDLRANGSCGGCSTRPPPAPRNSRPSTSRTSTWSGVPARPGHLQGRRDRVRPLGHRHGPHPAPAATRPHLWAGVPRRPARALVRWTLHQLRHSVLQHLADDGCTAPELEAKFRHLHLSGLGRYVQLGEQTSAQVTADADPAARRRTCRTDR